MHYIILFHQNVNHDKALRLKYKGQLYKNKGVSLYPTSSSNEGI